VKLSGTFPENSFTRILDKLEIAADFFGAKPQLFIISYIVSIGNFCMSSGLFATLKSSGVTLLTLSSVH
jgi:hypothetical protein